MLLASLLVPIAVVAIVLLVQRLRLPAFLAIMATVVVYGIAADMTFQSVGKAFGLGFTAALEQVGLLVVAGALVQALVLRTAARHRDVGRWPARWRASAPRRRAASPCCSRPARTRRAARSAWRSPCWPSAALVAPSPLAVAAASVMKAEHPHDAHGRAAGRRDRRRCWAGGTWRARSRRPRRRAGSTGRGSAVCIPDRAPDRAVGGADAERAAGQGRRARVLYRHQPSR